MELNSSVQIRLAEQSDAKKIAVLLKTVYIQTYGTEGVTDEYANFVEEEFSIEKISNKINQDNGFYLLATSNNHVLGVAEILWDMLNPFNSKKLPELSKLYVLDAFGRQKIGTKLLEGIERILQKKSAESYWLCVWALNPKAIQFYEKMGFKNQGIIPFQMETNCYENLVMTKKLQPL